MGVLGRWLVCAGGRRMAGQRCSWLPRMTGQTLRQCCSTTARTRRPRTMSAHQMRNGAAGPLMTSEVATQPADLQIVRGWGRRPCSREARMGPRHARGKRRESGVSLTKPPQSATVVLGRWLVCAGGRRMAGQPWSWLHTAAARTPCWCCWPTAPTRMPRAMSAHQMHTGVAGPLMTSEVATPPAALQIVRGAGHRPRGAARS